MAGNVFFLFGQWLKRDLAGRYRATALGMGWALVQPLSQLAVFVLVFYHVLGVRWPTAAQPGVLHYGMQVFLGLTVFNLVADTLQRAPHSVLAQPNLVTKVRFPLWVLPAAGLTASVLPYGLGLLLLGGVLAWSGQAAPVAWLQLVPVTLILLLYLLGLAWWLAATTVYLRDLAQVTAPLASLLLFLSPVFYSADHVPAAFAPWMAYNPVAWVIEAQRSILFQGGGLAPEGLVRHAAAATLVAAVGKWWFARLQRRFADVL